MHKTTLHNGKFDVELMANISVGFHDSDLLRLHELVMGLNAVHTVDRFELKKIPGVGRYEYRIDFTDGKEWIQELVVGAGVATKMTFDQIEGEWELGEFSPHRPLRNLASDVCLKWGIDKFTMKWL